MGSVWSYKIGYSARKSCEMSFIFISRALVFVMVLEGRRQLLYLYIISCEKNG